DCNSRIRRTPGREILTSPRMDRKEENRGTRIRLAEGRSLNRKVSSHGGPRVGARSVSALRTAYGSLRAGGGGMEAQLPRPAACELSRLPAADRAVAAFRAPGRPALRSVAALPECRRSLPDGSLHHGRLAVLRGAGRLDPLFRGLPPDSLA